MPNDLYGWVWIFLIYAILGWCMEEVFHAVRNGQFVNRGFLNGPWCPIYGFGMLVLIIFLFPLRGNLILLFICSTLLTTALELVTGFVLDKAFHSRWWNYSEKPFQFHGYICLQFSLCWGLAGTFLIAVVEEALFSLVKLIPYYTGHILLALLSTVFLLDCYLTVRTVLHLTRRVEALDDVSKGLRKISDDIGENLFKNVESVSGMAKSASAVLELSAEESRQKAERKLELSQMRLDAIRTWTGFHKGDFEKLKEKYSEAFSEHRFGEARLLRAFPQVKFTNHNDSLQKYKDYLLKLRNRKNSDANTTES